MKRIKGKLIQMSMLKAVRTVGMAVAASLVLPNVSSAQLASDGLTPAGNTFRSFQDASIARDSGLNQPLDLLNDFYPSIAVSISGNENVRRRPDMDESDTKVVVSPGLAYRTNIGRHQFYVGYTGVFTYHQDIDQEDAQAHNFNARGGFDITRAWDLDVFAGVGESFEERGVSGTLPFDSIQIGGFDNGPNEIEYQSYGADLIYGRKLGVLKAVLGYEYTETEFTNNGQGDENPAGDRSRETDSLHFDLNYRIASKTSIFGRVQYTETNSARSFRSLDSEQTDYVLGLRWKPTSALSGVVGIGRSDREFLDTSRENFEGTTYYVNLNYTINPFSTISLNASRAVEEPGDETSDFFISDVIGVSWNHAITPQLVFNARATFIEDDFNTDREDSFVDYGVGLDYAWRSYLTVGAFYGYVERESTLENIEYDDSFFGIRFRSDLRPLLRSRNQKRPEPSSFPAPKFSQAAQ